MSRYRFGYTDPRGLFGLPEKTVYTYEVRKETNTWIPELYSTYAVVKVTRTITTPYAIEPLYSGLSKEVAEGYVKLLTQPED